MRKKVFITGASGFVGSHLVEAVNSRGYEIHAAVRKSSKIDEIKHFVHEFVYPDMNNVDELTSLFQREQYSYIIHAAAMTKAKREEDMFSVNVGYTENILKASLAISQTLERVVYVSSLAAIGPIDFDSPSLITESTSYNPVTVYGRSKRASEEMIKTSFATSSISVLRPTAVYGPREKDLFILFDTLNKGLDPYIGSNSQKLSFIYVKDLVEGILNACIAPQQGLQFYNITDGQVYSRYAMADIFKKTFNRKPFRLHIPYGIVAFIAKISQSLYTRSKKTPVLYPERLGELTAENWACDIEKAKRELAFEPKYNLLSGLTETLLWYKSNNWL